jgi:hypothetical protein
LADQSDVLEIERLDQSDYRVPMEVKRVSRFVFGLVGATEAEEIRRNDAYTRRDERGNHFAVEIGPCGLPVQTERDRRTRPPLIEIMHAEIPRALMIMRGERISWQGREMFIRRAQDVHRVSPEFFWSVRQ